MERGRSYLAQDNLDKASIEFRNALQIQPRDAEASYLNGRVAERRGNLSEAAALYQAALEARPDYEQALASLGRVMVFGGAAQRALDTIRPGLIAHPDSADLLAVCAAARHQLKDDVEALADAQRAVQLAPNNPDAIATLGGLYAQAGDYPRAVSLMSDAVLRMPWSADLREALATLYFSSGQAEKGDEQLRQIIRLRPREFTPRLHLAIRYAQEHHIDQAQAVLQAAVEQLPGNAQAKLALVDFIAEQRSREQGERTLRDFITREPDNPDLRFGLGALLQRTGAVTEAIATYSEVIRREGTAVSGLVARDRIAALELARGHYEAAGRIVGEVLRINPRDADALIMRGNIAMERNDPAAAIVDFRTALRDQPNSASLQRLLARAYLANGDLALAEDALRAAVDDAPGDVAVRVEFAQFLQQTDRAPQAVTLLEETDRAAPNNLQVQEALARAYIAKHDMAAARRAAEDLKARRPQSAAGFYLAGVIAQSEKRWADSEQNLALALELQPGADMLAAVVREHLARGNAAAALARLQSAVEADPQNVAVLDLLGEVYLATRDLQRAAATLARAQEIEPARWQIHRDMALVKTAAGDEPGAIAEYEAALRLSPGDPALTEPLASRYERAGRIDAAIRCYEDLYNRNPRMRQFAGNNLAMLLVTYKSDRESLDRARDLSSTFATSDNSALLDTNGWVQFKRGEFQAAAVVLQRALERAPTSSVIRYHLGMAQLQLGQRDSAQSNLESALSGSGTFSGAEEARSALATLKNRSS
jgi:tetratricopeptide (TPR) repeat protein